MSGGAAVDIGVIIAGGGGKRLWPWTGSGRPKPLLPLGGGGRTLLGATLDRLARPCCSSVRIQAPSDVGKGLIAAEPRLNETDLDTEPSPRDTAPAVALAMRRVLTRRPDAVVAVVPADHRVGDETGFRTALAGAGRAAAEGAIVLLAIEPREPSTRYGWVECDGSSTASERLCVTRFVEKPDRATAERFAASGRHYLNAGIFVWRADVFWSVLEQFAPGIAAPVAAYVDGGKIDDWERATQTSIDYALLEKLPDLVAVPLKAEWSDVGSWDAVVPLVEAGDAGPARLVPSAGNAPHGSVVIAIGDRGPRRAVLLGDQALLVVHGPGGVLVGPRSEADGVKSFGG